MMSVTRKRRLYHVLMVLTGVAIGLTLLLTTLRRHVELYQTPSELLLSEHRPTMLGGMVVQGSVKHPEPMTVLFEVTDFKREVPVYYHGVLPALFREGQGVVLKGHVDAHGVFKARQVLAKHDENYRPPGIQAKGQRA